MFYPASIDEFDLSPDGDEPKKTHGVLSLAVLFVLLVHFVLVMFFIFDLIEAGRSTVISIELVPEKIIEPEAIFEPEIPKTIPEPVIQEPVETIAEPITDIAEVVQEQEAIQEQEPLQSAPRIRTTLYLRAIEAIRNDSLPKAPSFKTFSTRDFPQKENPGRYQPVRYLVPVITMAKVMESRSNDGTFIIKRSDGYGNVTCFQERGPTHPFELLNQPLWYPVPDATCGHIK